MVKTIESRTKLHGFKSWHIIHLLLGHSSLYRHGGITIHIHAHKYTHVLYLHFSFIINIASFYFVILLNTYFLYITYEILWSLPRYFLGKKTGLLRSARWKWNTINSELCSPIHITFPIGYLRCEKHTHNLTPLLLAPTLCPYSPSALTQNTMDGKKGWNSSRMSRIWSDEESESILTGEAPADTKYPSQSQPFLFPHIVIKLKGFRDLLLEGKVLYHSK